MREIERDRKKERDRETPILTDRETGTKRKKNTCGNTGKKTVKIKQRVTDTQAECENLEKEKENEREGEGRYFLFLSFNTAMLP